jgi:PEP-CTERM motif
MMKAGIIALAALIASSAASRASVTYVVDLNFFDPRISVEGSIETDGKVGVLSLSDIEGFNLIVSDAVSAVNFIPAFSIVTLFGNGLVSPGRDLTFAYGDSDGSLFSFQQIDRPGVWCNGAGGQSTCGQGITVEGIFSAEPTFLPVTKTLTIGSVPEPSTWVMVLAGFAGLGFMGWRSRRLARDDGGSAV